MLWKTRYGRCIYRGADDLAVYDNLYFRWLMLGGDALQTVLNKFAPYKPALAYINPLICAAKADPGTTCMLGLGGAGVAHALSPVLNDKLLTAVELSNDVISTASRFFMLNKLANIEVINDDANLFVSSCTRQFKHLLIDLSNAYSFPANCNNAIFFENCQRLLTADGVLAINIANWHEQRIFFEKLVSLFNNAIVCIPVKNCANVIFLASNSKSPDPLLAMLENNSDVRQLTWESNWGYVATFK